jgi:SAM-dependent methyltransferase
MNPNVAFRCNVCGAENQMREGGFARDEASCAECNSSVRLRALLRALSVELFNAALELPDFPTVKSIRGLGMSDNAKCASLLAAKLDYRNTFYHQEPRFDAGQPATAECGIYDFVLASDIFEHVAPPVEQSLRNVIGLLKPNGFLAMSVPYSLEDTTREHFGDLHNHSVVKAAEHLALVNRRRDGKWQVFDHLVFHGGPGSTLELRVFSEADLRRLLAAAGCGRLNFIAEDYPPFGITHQKNYSLPVVAGNDAFHLSREGVGELANELARYRREIERLEDLCRDLSAHIKKIDAEFDERSRWALSLKAEVDEWTEWGLGLQAELGQRKAEAVQLARENDELRRKLASWETSRWVHLGRVFGLGPKPLNSHSD